MYGWKQRIPCSLLRELIASIRYGWSLTNIHKELYLSRSRVDFIRNFIFEKESLRVKVNHLTFDEQSQALYVSQVHPSHKIWLKKNLQQ